MWNIQWAPSSEPAYLLLACQSHRYVDSLDTSPASHSCLVSAYFWLMREFIFHLELGWYPTSTQTGTGWSLWDGFENWIWSGKQLPSSDMLIVAFCKVDKREKPGRLEVLSRMQEGPDSGPVLQTMPRPRTEFGLQTMVPGLCCFIQWKIIELKWKTQLTARSERPGL